MASNASVDKLPSGIEIHGNSLRISHMNFIEENLEAGRQAI
ncbi:hypothetical protein [Vibrio sp. ABG19]|nr:hypothetical protein [Vibrio sp. ABG19]